MRGGKLIQKTVLSEARTNKLYCSDCNGKITKGETLIFIINVYDDGEKEMQECYCRDCGHDLIEIIIHENALEEAIGHGQC